uniref:Golgin subfamily A member 6-like protein 22 isoform X10 n=1 Tax=Crassostrea virginica TaxID=6565 RepID=A0A8B8AQA8_CRAVI|nr:golgin subfamily A member 6-like protein 22 isoform X10 [Crassostrea virginica]
MLSPLTRGYGSWDGVHFDPYSDQHAEEKLPLINEQEPHRHGVTIGHMSRSSTSLSYKSNIAPPATPISRSEKLQRETTHNRLSRETTYVDHSSKYDLPKTFLTKKGALMLFTAPKDDDQEVDESSGNPRVVRTQRVKKILDSSLKIGSLDRLAMSILQYGDEEDYDKENTSITDEKKKMFLKILRKEENQRELDTRSQPGSDLNSYLRDLKFRASYKVNMSGDTNIPRSREAMELRAILQGLQDNRWPIVYNTESRTFENRSSYGDQFTRPPSQQSSRTQISQGSGSTTPRSILSASKLRASLKSYNTYMGRPASEETVNDIRSSLPRVTIRHSSAPSSRTRSSDAFSPGKGRRRVNSSITGGSIVEEDEGGLPLYYDPLSEDEAIEKSPEISTSPSEDKGKKKQSLTTHDEKVEAKGIGGDTGSTEPSATTKGEEAVPTRLVDQMPVIPDYLKPKPQKTPKTKEKKSKKQTTSKPKKDVTKAISVASLQPESEGNEKKEAVAKVWEHQKIDIPPEKEELVIPEHMKEAFNRDTDQSKAALEEQMQKNCTNIRNTNNVANILDDTLKHTIEEEYLETGLTEEELLEAKMAVEEKLMVAQAKIDEMEKTGTLESDKSQENEKAVQLKEGKGKRKGGRGGKSPSKDSSSKSQAKMEKDAQVQKILKKEQKKIDEKKKLEEKRKLDEEIRARQEIVEDHEQKTRDKELKRGKAAKKEIKLEMERLMREELEMQEAVDEVHKYLAESRKRQREERDNRRKADQDRRREQAKEKFEQDKKKREEESRKVMEELDRIHDLEMRKQKKLEEEMKREEEERIAIEQAEEEEKERVRAEEEQERRLREIEVQMEEEEMQRLYNQEQEISRQRILLEMEREKMAEEEEKKRQELLAEQKRYEEIKRKQEEEEQRILEEQRRRLQELKDMEEAAKLKLQQDLEERRAKALARREENLENRSNMDKLKHSQGITKSWVFSYFVRWPLESYMTPLGGDESKKKGFRPKSRPKTAK